MFGTCPSSPCVTRATTRKRYGKAGVAQAEGGGSDPIDMMKSMFGGDSFADTFGDLNMWETIKIQVMMSGEKSVFVVCAVLWVFVEVKDVCRWC